MIRKWGAGNGKGCSRGVGNVARLYQHRTYGTYYTKRNVSAGVVLWQIHPDGVAFLKYQGIVIGGDIPSYAMRILHDRSWLFTREEAAQCREIDWAPAWADLDRVPVGHYPVWLARQKRDCAALMASSRRMAEGEQRAHQKEEAAALSVGALATQPSRPGRIAALPASSTTIAFAHPQDDAHRELPAAADSLLWLVIVLTALAVIAIVAVVG